MNHQETLTTYLASFIQELSNSGVRDVVISPGSRSTPLALLIAEHPTLKYHINIDERSAAFFALGIAKQTRKPVALLCTSGTAAANYFPAIVEAKLSRIPLIVLTADRPHELRDIGAPQAIDQIHLYGKHVKWFVEMALPEIGEEMTYYARTTATRAISTSLQQPAGPVHLNFPIREPLLPRLDPSPFEELENRPAITVKQGDTLLESGEMKKISERLQRIEKGVIVCGVIDYPQFSTAVLALADALGYPIIADPLSQLRSGSFSEEYIIDSYDAILKEIVSDEMLYPDVIIRFGGMPVSKPLTKFMKRLAGTEQYMIEAGNSWRDPINAATQMIYCDETLFCEGLLKQLDEKRHSNWLEMWQNLNRIARNTIINEISDITELDEGKLVLELVKRLPQNSHLFVGNSMPIRDVDTFFHFNQQNIRVLANRGANGIDGVVSSALGASLYGEPLFLLIGDLSFFHDLNGLLAAKMHQLNITIIVINNNGGGIFSFLPQSNEPKHFEALFGTPTDIDFEYAVKMYSGRYSKVRNWDEFHHSMNEAITLKGLNVIEVPTNRNANVDIHRKMWKRVSAEIEQYVHGEKE
ncbi:2-succinyl-5-enolpyruvyl-6-hydroxy-3-cyclohexene-1-carboxylic-acid synthase [Heyndrickxia sporothermodurans]|uniref:2-succinyl-5-enolpyruvyl-6-hydroxy-3-cyclohexene-1-carboxylate synthase n=1 Tax=Heyndrickxia sporothermodurans TaxID=46224 RepID=A0A150KK16_9BACI|nr:2-succinyl-5-enolpyruvyl-6-hydroxy-3-cyclohexene-1-carboxylic-acid synthase [Heyndrickxia sporothermodurans]KYC84858.1 2-succinyl-5-enolpyruvyl-6-hydroxy-3-cyclohexene-1-carboxylic-acid synthase [Heyndrickxia sporothermodurans]